MQSIRSLVLSLILVAATLLAVGCKKQETATEEAPTTSAEGSPISITIEVDQLAGTTKFLNSTEINAEAELQDIFEPAGISITLQPSDLELPPASPLSERDLAAWRHDHQNISSVGPTIYCLIAIEGPRPDLRGLMFATDTRDAVAVFTHDLETSSAIHRDREIVRRLAHEIAHALNLHHADLEPDGAFREGGSIESSSDEKTVQWKISQHSIDHFLQHPQCEWLPNSGNPFLFVQPSHINPQHRASEQFETADCKTTLHITPHALFMADADLQEDTSLHLQLIPSQPAIDLSEPIILKAVIENKGTQTVELPALLLENGFLTITVQNLAEPTPQLFVPLSIRDDDDLRVIRLQPGESAAQDLKVFFGARGWTFSQPGRYLIRARYHTGESIEAPTIQASTELQVNNLEPQIATATRELMNDPEIGRFLLYEGAAHLSNARQKLNNFLTQYSDAPQASLITALMALDALSPSRDPATGRQFPIRLAEARHLLSRLHEPRLLSRLPLSIFVRASLLQATHERLDVASRILSETATVVKSRVATKTELVFGEQDTLPVLEKVLTKIPGARKALRKQGIDMDNFNRINF